MNVWEALLYVGCHLAKNLVLVIDMYAGIDTKPKAREQ